MIETTWIPEAIRAATWLYGAVFLVSLGLALVLPKTRTSKLSSAVVVVAMFGYLPVRGLFAIKEEQAQATIERDVRQERLKLAVAQFETRCKLAGEKISRTVENVDGIVWMKWRPKNLHDDDQFRLDDPYGRDCSGEECIAQLLRVTSGSEHKPEAAMRHREGYRYVETVDPAGGGHYRYVRVIKSVRKRTAEQIEQAKKNSNGIDPGPDVYDLALERQPIERFTARYGVTWDDISTREDREHWIAGGSLKVIELKTDEVIAERVGFMMDRGLGNKAGYRSPWGDAPATACPPFPLAVSGRPFLSNRGQGFLNRVLAPTKGE